MKKKTGHEFCGTSWVWCGSVIKKKGPGVRGMAAERRGRLEKEGKVDVGAEGDEGDEGDGRNNEYVRRDKEISTYKVLPSAGLN